MHDQGEEMGCEERIEWLEGEIKYLEWSHRVLRKENAQLRALVHDAPEPCATIWCRDDGGMAEHAEWEERRDKVLIGKQVY